MSGEYEIKIVEAGDRSTALALIWEVFLEFEASEYSEEGVEEFRKFIGYDAITEKMEKSDFVMWCCFLNQEIVGVLAYMPLNHISMLFVHKRHHRQGIARALFQRQLTLCRAMKITQITVNSSPYAVEVYHRLGFEDTDIERTVNGIRFVPMKYTLH